jgi:hypothetical protein
MVEQQLQAALELVVHWSGRAPEEAVVDQHEVGCLGCCTLEQVDRGADARDHSANLRLSGYLQAVGSIVVERRGVQEGVEVADEVIDGGGLQLVDPESSPVPACLMTNERYSSFAGGRRHG